MTHHGEYDYEFNDPDPRPAKRPRQLKEGDDGHRPFIPMSGASGVQNEGDGAGEGVPKKGRKRPLSCGECRRLKLKCDRVFPCQSCCKRGCAEICPEGALTGGKGSRFILANTEQLHEKIKTMSERIRLLEDALQNSHARNCSTEHPLLRRDLLLIKKSPELFGIDQQQLAVHSERTPDGQPRHDDRVAEDMRAGSSPSSREGEEVRVPDVFQSAVSPHDRRQQYAMSMAGPIGNEQYRMVPIPDELARLSRSFPSPWSISYELDLKNRQQIRELLPPRVEAQHLCEQARRNAFWQFNADASETFVPNLLHSVYTTQLSILLPHRLGLFLMILAIGSVVDLTHGPDRGRAEHFHHLARAALCEVPVMDDTSFDAVNALFFMEWYLLVFSDHKRSAEYASGIMGLATKLAHTIALHRDGVRSKVIPEEQDRRRTLFWDLVGTDARLALMLRHPPTINMRHVDAKQPYFGSADTPDAQYHQWQYSFLIQCTIPVLDVVTSPQSPSYVEVLTLDYKIRDYHIPPALQMIDNDGIGPNHPLAMQQAMTSCTRDVALLQLHKCFFTQALISSEPFTVKHKHAPSVLAVYSSACNLIWTTKTLYKWDPDLSTRFTIFWSNCFSAACALAFLIARAPSLPITPYALQELDKVTHLFTEVQDQSSRVHSYLKVLDTLVARSREHYMSWRKGLQTNTDEQNDEICMLVRRIIPSTCNGHVVGPTTVADPFENAHPYLRRCLEQATAADPCMETGLHLTRIRGPVGTILHAQSDVRSYSMPGESLRPISSGAPHLAKWSSPAGEAYAPASSSSNTSFSAIVSSADIADSSWMSWL